MSNFVYDVVTLNGSKANRAPLPGGEDPNKWIQAAEDWNPTIAALYDIRGAILSNLFFGVDRQGSAPIVPTGGSIDFLWADAVGDLYWHKDGTGDQKLNTGGGGNETLAETYAEGSSQADSTISYDSTRGFLWLKQDAGAAVTDLFMISNDAEDETYLYVSPTTVAFLDNAFYFDAITPLFKLSGSIDTSASNTYDIGNSFRNFRRIYTRNLRSDGSFITINLGGIDYWQFGSNLFPINDGGSTIGIQTTNRLAAIYTQTGEVDRPSMGATADLGRGLLFRSTNSSGVNPYVYSSLAEWRSSSGNPADPESGGQVISRWAVQARNDTISVGSPRETDRLAFLYDQGTGTAYTEWASLGKNGFSPFADATLTLGTGTTKRWSYLGLGNDSTGISATVGASISNLTAATAGNPKYSPMVVFRGSHWQTGGGAAPHPVEAAHQLQNVDASTFQAELAWMFRYDASGSWKYAGGVGWWDQPYIYLQNDTEGSWWNLQTGPNGTQMFGNRNMEFSTQDITTDSGIPPFSFVQTDDSANTRFFVLYAPRITGVTTEYRDFDLPNTQPVQFDGTGGITVAAQRQIYLKGRIYTTTAGTATLTQAATVYIDGGPVAGGGVTIGAGYALFVNSGDIAQKAHSNYAGSESAQTTSSVQTANATPAQVWTKTLTDNMLYWVDVTVIGRDAAGTERAMYNKRALVYRQGGGGATIQGSVQNVVADVETTGSMDGTITVSGDDVRVTVTGVAATTINWVATVRLQAVATNS